jgi:hypothetical protein
MDTINTVNIDTTIDENNHYDANIIEQILNEFMIYHKGVNHLTNKTSMFDGIDTSNVTATNKQMEEFYDAQYKFITCVKAYEHFTNVCCPASFNDNKDYELFSIRKNNKLHLLSHSLFALLIEIVNLKNECTDVNIKYDIIPIRHE